MVRVFIGIPKSYEYPEFYDSLSSFCNEARKKYQIVPFYVHNRKRDDARERIVKEFLKTTC